KLQPLLKGGLMATQPNVPYEYETEEIELTVRGQKIYDDLRLYYLPDQTVNFVVDGPDEYLVLFDNRDVFGTSLPVLTKGNNLFRVLKNNELRARIYGAGELVRTLGVIVASPGVIIIGPPPPKFPVEPAKVPVIGQR